MQNDEDEEDEEDAVPAPDDDVLEDEDEEEEGEDDEEPDPNASVRLCRLMSNAVFLGFESHVRDLERARERRREALAFKSAVEEGTAAADEASAKQTQDDLDGLGVWREGDTYQGDVNMRTLQKLLARVDARGFERYAQKTNACLSLPTHSAERATQVSTAIGIPRRIHESGRTSEYNPKSTSALCCT